MQVLSKSLRWMGVHDSHAQRLRSKKQEARLSRVAQPDSDTLRSGDSFFSHDYGQTIVNLRVLGRIGLS